MFWVCSRAKCNKRFAAAKGLKQRILAIPVHDRHTKDLTGFFLLFVGETKVEQGHAFTLFKTAKLIQQVYMLDGSCINLGYDALVKAVEQLNAESSEKMLKFLRPELHAGSTRSQLEANWWVPHCENRALSRHELGGHIKMIKLTEEEKNKNRSSSKFLDDLISLMCTFCLFDTPREQREKGMESTNFVCWQIMHQ